MAAAGAGEDQGQGQVGEDLSLAPQWLKLHGLHSPGGAAGKTGLRDSRQVRSTAARGGHETPAVLQPLLCSAPHSAGEERTAGWSPKPHSSRGPSSRNSSSSRRSLEDRYHSMSSPFNTPATGSHATHSSTSGAAPGSWQHDRLHHQTHTPRGIAGASGAAANGHAATAAAGSVHRSLAATSSASHTDVHTQLPQGLQWLSSLQRTVSEGSGSSGPAAAGAGGGQQHLQQHYAAAGASEDKLSWRDSSSRSSRSHGVAAVAAGAASGSNATGAAASNKLGLNPLDFPSLGASSASSTSPCSSTGKQAASPQPYIPSLAPYKQGFLASRASGGWTSKLAEVPVAADGAGGAPDGAEGQPRAAGAGAGCSASGSSNSKTISGSAAGAGAADKASRGAGWSAGAAPAGTASAAAVAAAKGSARAAGAQQSLAETLKQAAAAAAANGSAAAAQDHRRHGKTLVPLLPGCKAKHSGSTTRTASSAASLKLVDVAKGGSGGRRGLGGAADLASPTGHMHTHPPLLKLSHSTAPAVTSAAGAGNSSPHDAVAPGATAGAAGLGGAGAHLSNASDAAAGHAVGVPAQAAAAASLGAPGPNQQCKTTGVVGCTGASEQRQQLRDRHSFFAVLKRKTSSSSSSQGSGVGAGNDTSGDAAAAAPGADSSGDASAAAAAAAAASDDDVTTSPAAAADQDPSAGSSQDTNSSCANARAAACAPAQQQQQSALCVAEHSRHVVPASADPARPKSTNSDRDTFGAMVSGGMGRPGHAQHCTHSHDHTPHHDHGSTGMLWDVPEEEEAFLRSLGWTAVSSDDDEEWGLTEEEIAAFQASAAARAAAQQAQQHDAADAAEASCGMAGIGSYPSVLQMQQKAQLLQGSMCRQGLGLGQLVKGFGGAGGVLRARGGVRGVGVGGYAGVGLGVGGQGQCGLLLGVYLPPAELLGFDSYDGSSSSSDCEEGES